MMYEANQQPTPYCLSNTVQKAYEKIKALISKIFSVIKKHTEGKNLKEEFYDSYIDFAKKLDKEGFNNESNSYMDICDMYYNLMDRPDVLIYHESFFNDFFNEFDKVLYARINNPEDYERIYNEFLMYSGEMQEYYYTEVAIPSPFYDEKTTKEIIGKLAGDLDEESISRH